MLMYEMMYANAKDMLLISFNDFRACLETHVEKRKTSKEQKAPIECPPEGVLITTSIKMEQVVSDLLLPEDRLSAVGASVMVIQHILPHTSIPKLG